MHGSEIHHRFVERVAGQGLAWRFASSPIPGDVPTLLVTRTVMTE